MIGGNNQEVISSSNEIVVPLNDGLTIPEANIRVTGKIISNDEDFLSYLKEVGDPEAFFNQVVTVITCGKGECQGFHYPTGGRVQVFQLKKPFHDREFSRHLGYVDVKGVGLTSAGRKRFRDRFPEAGVIDNSEVLIAPERGHNETWGLFCLNEARAEFNGLQEARWAGIVVPYPAAVVELGEFSFNGVKRPADEVLRGLGIRGNQLACLIRLYQDPARISDLFRTDILDNRLWRQLRDLYYGRKCGQIKELLKDGELKWQEWKRSRQIGDDGAYYIKFYQLLTAQVARMIEYGLSPVTGVEFPDRGLCHTNLHNLTLKGEVVEWFPITKINELRLENMKAHLEALTQDFHRALVALGAAIPNVKIPYYDEFSGDVINSLPSGLRGRASLEEIRKNYIPDPNRAGTFRGDSDFLAEYVNIERGF